LNQFARCKNMTNPTSINQKINIKLFFVVIVTLFCLVGGLVWYFKGSDFLTDRVLGIKKQANNTVVKAEEEKFSAFKQVTLPIYLPPIKITFLQKAVIVEEVSVEPDGTLETPKTWQTAGWYKKGAMPGEEGNVVIDGHYDTNTGAPGAFWELKNLQTGDKVSLTDKLGRVFQYIVSSKSYYSINDPERSKIFESGKDKVLTVITCGGIWDYSSGTYNKRLVINAVFDKMEKNW
jgi:LPXTG-site transpeptidase (sortase) family protein